MSADMPVIPVNEEGVAADGDDFSRRALPSALRDGLMSERKVLLQYPSGRKRRATQVMVTPKGLARLRDEFAVSLN